MPADVQLREPDGQFFEIDGERVAVPVEVRSAKMVAAQFFVDGDATQQLIDYSGLRVARQRNGKAMCALSAVQYTDNDLGPYNEFAVAIVVMPHDAGADFKPSFRKVTTLIHKLPVNQTYTCRIGKGLWGFPKWVTEIDYVESADRTRATLVDDGEFVLSLEVRRGIIPLPAAEMEMSCYSWDDGVLRLTPWTTRSRRMRARPGGALLELGPNHPMAHELRSLDLPKRALMTTGTSIMTATFGAPIEITL